MGLKRKRWAPRMLINLPLLEKITHSFYHDGGTGRGASPCSMWDDAGWRTLSVTPRRC
ncbi:hypothetical protein GCM10025857_28310 [Alicyclobacillus contaminans]|nr:hypothetical protein GCM10025857_28310 [Alicyclobacillus contaminans]